MSTSSSPKKRRKNWVHCEDDDITCPACGYQLCNMGSFLLTTGDEYVCPGCNAKNMIVGSTTLEIHTVQTVKAFNAGQKAPDPEWSK